MAFRTLIATLAVTAAASGCGAAATPAPAHPGPSPQDEAELEALRERAADMQARARELEGQLALARAEARDLRDELAGDERSAPRETVRIGEEHPPVDPNLPPWEPPPAESEDAGPRPVLRLYGRPQHEASSGQLPPLVLPPAPSGVPDRLPVAPLPGEGEVPGPVPSASAPPQRQREPTPARDPAEVLYREALASVRDRRFDLAGRALDALLEQHGDHPRALDARYWRGVVRYAQRQYTRALADFREVVEGHGDSERAPDALYKMALCHQRMGDAERARALFRLVRTRYPDSVAARVASQQEDAS